MKTYNVFYLHPDYAESYRFGTAFPVVGNLHKSHRHVRQFEATDLEDVFMQMQGEVWSPCGEQRGKIQRLGLHHTSMSVGDVIYDQEADKHFVVAPIGMKEIK